jgi:hypothetical protein
MIAKIMAHQSNSTQASTLNYASTIASFVVLVTDSFKATSLKAILEVGVMKKTYISCCYEWSTTYY